MPFRTALSGLDAAAADLRVTGNNVANAGTNGFKESRAEFAELFARSSGSIATTTKGSGTRLAAVTQQFRQGNIDFTGNAMDMALSGQGFFVLDDGGTRVYTRNGAFQVDRDGHVVNAAGHHLQVYAPADDSGDAFNLGDMGDLRLDTSDAPPRATSAVEASLNLSSEAEDLSAVAFDAADPSTYAYSTSLNVFDSLGQRHEAKLYFRNLGSLDWEVRLTVGGQEVGSGAALEFGPDGTLQSPAGAVSFGAYQPVNGAEALDIDFDFSALTQHGGDHAVHRLHQDGHATGRMTGVDVDDNGVVFARYSNGEARPLGKVAVAGFLNPQGLQSLGDNLWGDTFAAGEPQFGEAGKGNLGTIQAGGLEASNVDIAEQLVKLITAQRNFQANAQVISTADAVTQSVINIR